MGKDSIEQAGVPELLQALMTLVAAHRRAFGQERTYRRGVALVLAEVMAFGRHTVTQLLLTLGLGDGDWSSWYRLFSQERYEEEEMASCLLAETVENVAETAPYVVGVDATQIRRSRWNMPGTSWLRAPGTAPFMRGIARAQRFVHGAWLPAMVAGYTRAVPLRFLPAFPAKAVA